MNKTVLINFIILTSFIFSQCDNYNETQCSNDNNCEWVENIEWGSCSDLNPYMNNGVSYCNDTSTSTDQCYTYTCYGGGYGQWNVCCDGLDYEIDNSYCQEIEMPECSELDQNTCNHPSYGEGCEWIEGDTDCESIDSEFSCNSNSCEWIEDVDYGSCANFSYNQCSSISDCDWVYGCIQWGSWYSWICYDYGYECEGSYQIDNSYCDGESGYCEESWDIIGDLNFDGTINIQDVIQVIELILNQEYNNIGDMNNDEIINVSDVIQIINIILN